MSQGVKLKLVALGDGESAKARLLLSLSSQEVPKSYVPTVFDNYAITFSIDGISVNLGLWDTAGAEQYNRLRPLAYPHCDIFLLVFSMASRSSYTNAIKRYYPEAVQNLGNRAARIFVGNHIQVIDPKQHKESVSSKEAKKQIEGNLKQRFMECDMNTRKGIKELLFEATRTALKKKHSNSLPKPAKNNCQII